MVTQPVVRQMSTGVSAFEQLLIDFEYRGEADIDVPVLVLGMGLTKEEEVICEAKRQLWQSDPSKLIEEGRVKSARKGALPGPK